MTTPEGEVKDEVKALLARYYVVPASDVGKKKRVAEPCGWYFMPVKSQFGTSGIPDFVGHFLGKFWAVETKAPGKKPTGLQALQIELIGRSGVEVFVVDGPESLEKFKRWLADEHAEFWKDHY